MPKVSVIVVIYNSKKFILPVFESIISQTYKDLEIIAVINKSDDGSEELIRTKFPQVRLIRPGKNLGFAAGNNFAISRSGGELIQLVNPDLILEPDYIEKLTAVFTDEQVAAATGKLLRYDFQNHAKTNIIDSTGIVMSKSGRARDRGQLEIDRNQYDQEREVFAVSGAGPMYRRSALEKVAYKDLGIPESGAEFFDEDFFAYWEDVDLSWRLNRVSLNNVYVPEAVAYHGRTAGQAKGGYLHLLNFIKHHQTIPPLIKQLNYKNHILMYVKNATFPHLAFILREMIMFGYVLLFEPSTLKVLPELFRQLPKIWKKRKNSPQE